MAALNDIFGADDENAAKPGMPLPPAMNRVRLLPPPFGVATPPIFEGSLPGSAATAAAPAAPEVSPHTSESFPTTPQSSTNTTPGLDEIMKARQTLEAIPTAPPKVSVPWYAKLAGVVGAGLSGASGHGAEGVQGMERIMQAPQEKATKDWEAQRSAANQNLEDAIRSYDVNLATSREQREAQNTAAEQQNRQDTLGIEKQRLTNEKTAQDRAEQDRQATLQLERDRLNRPTNEVDLAVQMQERGPDGKPTPAALTAGQAYNQIRKDKLDQIHQTRDPNEKARLLVDEQSNLTQIRAQYDRQLAQLQASPEAQANPQQFASRLKPIQDSIAGIDKDLEYIRGEVGKLGGFTPPSQAGRTPIAQFQGSRGFTVAMQGKPSLQKNLTYEQVQRLQAAGVQLTPVPSKPAPKAKPAVQ